MKTAEELAEHICPLIFQDIPNSSKVIIAGALTEFANSKVTQALDRVKWEYELGFKEGMAKRNELDRREIELANRIVDGVKDTNDHILDVAKEARAEALADKQELVDEAYRVGWHEALEEAAKLILRDVPGARSNRYDWVADRFEYFAKEIRALKGSPRS